MPLRTLGLFLLMCLLWASTWSISKVGVTHTPPILFAGTRFLIASFMLASVLCIRRVSFKLSSRELKALIFLGSVVFALPFGLMMWGMQYTTGGIAVVILATNPIFVLLLGLKTAARSEMTLQKSSGIFICLCGTVFIFLPEFLNHQVDSIKGNMAILLSSLIFAVGMLVTKKYLDKTPADKSTFYQTLFAMPLLFLAGFLFEDGGVYWQGLPVLESWGPALYLALVGNTLGITLFFWFIKHYGTNIASASIYPEIVFALLIDYFFFGLTPSGLAWVGIGCILLGVWLVTRKPGRRSWFKKTPEATLPVTA